MSSQISNFKSQIAIAGAGPAGSSLAIRLASLGFETILVEQKHFPRQKLCGEFISPECLTHFQELGVFDEMLAAGGDPIFETRFFEVGGRSVAVPSSWFGGRGFALSLSRAEMDNLLLERARRAGVDVLDGVSVTGVENQNGRVDSLTARTHDGETINIAADIFVDATGRAGMIGKLAGKHKTGHKPSLVGFKAHLENVDVAKGICEIYSFPGGYAGLAHIEHGLANLCFLIRSDVVRTIGNNAGDVVEQVLQRNKRAATTLERASAVGTWLAVSVEGFGVKNPAPATNLFSVGDAASFIDPFTGSGMLMAFESAKVLADAIAAHATTPEQLGAVYRNDYREKFSRRLRVCSMLRRTAFMPTLATGIVSALRISSTARKHLARATRAK